MKKIFLSLLVFFSIVSFGLILVRAEDPVKVELTDGVSIRVDEHAGLKWQAKVSEHIEGATYGMLFGQGELAIDQMTIDNDDLYNTEDDAVLDELKEIGEDQGFEVTMQQFPKAAAVQDITVRAYAKIGGTYYYSPNVVVRNLAEVALEAKNSIDGEFVDAIAENVFANYVKQYKIGDVIYINDSLYEYEPLALAEFFIKDWNKVLDEKVTSMDGFGAKYIGTYADEGTKDAVTSNKVYQFFNANEGEMLAKWGWLLNYLSDTAGNPYVTSQVKLINGKTLLADSNSGWWGARHLLSRIQGFFTRANATGTGFNCSTYATDSELPGLVEVLKGLEDKFYTVVDSKFIKAGEDYTFPSQEAVNGYTSSWVSGSNLYENESKYTVSIDTFASFTSEYTPITYGVKFFDGETELTTLAKEYTIESSTLTLPEYVKEGYQFLGWYDNASFEGDPIASIPSGSFGDKVYFASLSSSPISEITFDYMDSKSIKEVYDEFRADVQSYQSLCTTKYTTNSKQFLTYSAGNSYSYDYLPLNNLIVNCSEFNAKWSWLFDYIADVRAEASLGWETKVRELKNGKNDTEGIYVFCQEMKGLYGNKQATAYGSASMYDWSTDVNNKKDDLYEITKTPNKAVNLIRGELITETPIRDGYVFAGWFSSKEFIGEQVTLVPDENQTLYARWYTNVSVTLDANGGTLPSEYAYLGAENKYTIHEYNNNAATAGNNVFCDTSVLSYSSLRWCYKILLKYDEKLNLYEVVCVDAAKASANDAATTAGVTWTHAIYNETKNISTEFTVGQYLLFENKPVAGMSSCEAAVIYGKPEICTIILNSAKLLLNPVREGYKFLGWKSSLDESIVNEYPGYFSNPGNITYTAQWEAITE